MNARSMRPYTSALPVSALYMALIIYASLFPFTGWRWPSGDVFQFWLEPWPRYWSRFDVFINVLGYLPLGLLLAWTGVRRGHKAPAWRACLIAAVISAVLETLQTFLPLRVPSNFDWVFNVTGAALGTAGVLAFKRLGGFTYWARLRSRWFLQEDQGALVLLLLWPGALLFPTAVPLGLGHVQERLWLFLETGFGDEWLQALGWDAPDFPILSSLSIALCVALGLLVPACLAYSAVRTRWQRFVALLALIGAALGVCALSSALTYGPDHAWAWLQAEVQQGLVMGFVLGLSLLWLGRRWSLLVLLMVLTLQLSLLNQSTTGAYFAQTLQTWEQGRFMRFHGLMLWLGWLWPYALLVYVFTRFTRRHHTADHS